MKRRTVRGRMRREGESVKQLDSLNPLPLFCIINLTSFLPRHVEW